VSPVVAYGWVMQMRRAEPGDEAFLVEMARLACTLEGRPVPDADGPEVAALLAPREATVIAADDDGRVLGAAWCHVHDPPLLRDDDDEPLPELVMAVLEAQRGRGIGTALVDALAGEAAQRFSALTLNVHLRNPAVRLYMRTGFRVAAAGRGWFGVAMKRPLHAVDAQ